MYRFTGFTEKANNAMNRAIEKAEELGHNYIGSEHVLYGFFSGGGGGGNAERAAALRSTC